MCVIIGTLWSKYIRLGCKTVSQGFKDVQVYLWYQINVQKVVLATKGGCIDLCIRLSSPTFVHMVVAIGRLGHRL